MSFVQDLQKKDPYDPSDLLSELREKVPSQVSTLYSIEDLYERRLYHQLTSEISTYLDDDASKSTRLQFWGFVKTFQNKLNGVKVVQASIKVAEELEINAALEFLKETSTLVKQNQEAYVLSLTETAYYQLALSRYSDARTTLDEAQSILDRFDSVELLVYANFYKVNAVYYKSKADYAPLYRTLLLYLACVDLASMTDAEKKEKAYELSISALLGVTIYNFGELLLHPILDSLKDNELSWLRELLLAMNDGNIAAFDQLRTPQNLTSQPLIAESNEFLQRKVCLMALIEIVFQRPPQDRNLSFLTIASETGVQEDEVEHLVMKALSLDLIRGSIDEVDKLVHVTWVQPRVLNRKQVDVLCSRLESWNEQIKTLESTVNTIQAAA